jgi:hypothetical protein
MITPSNWNRKPLIGKRVGIAVAAAERGYNNDNNNNIAGDFILVSKSAGRVEGGIGILRCEVFTISWPRPQFRAILSAAFMRQAETYFPQTIFRNASLGCYAITDWMI